MSALTDLFSSIAESIRGKSGSSAQIAAANFPSAINNLAVAKVISIPGNDSITVQSNALIGATQFSLTITVPSGYAGRNAVAGVVYDGTTITGTAFSSNGQISKLTPTFDAETGTIRVNTGNFVRNFTYVVWYV